MQTIGVITNDQHGVFQQRVIEGIHEVSKNYHVVIDSYAENASEPRPIMLNPSEIDGLIGIANAAPESYLQAAYQAGVPVSLISHQTTGFPVVMSNNAQGIAALVEHLITRCYRKNIVFIRGIPEQIDADQREEAFRRELLRYDRDVIEDYFLRGDFTPSIAVDSLQNFIETGILFDAVISSDYLMAKAIIETLTKNNIHVPTQVSVVAFGDAPEAEQAGLTTVAADVKELGRRATYQLMSQMNGLAIRGVTTLSVELVIRESCGYKL